jgi:hypothetical protein
MSVILKGKEGNGSSGGRRRRNSAQQELKEMSSCRCVLYGRRELALTADEIIALSICSNRKQKSMIGSLAVWICEGHAVLREGEEKKLGGSNFCALARHMESECVCVFVSGGQA